MRLFGASGSIATRLKVTFSAAREHLLTVAQRRGKSRVFKGEVARNAVAAFGMLKHVNRLNGTQADILSREERTVDCCRGAGASKKQLFERQSDLIRVADGHSGSDIVAVVHRERGKLWREYELRGVSGPVVTRDGTVTVEIRQNRDHKPRNARRLSERERADPRADGTPVSSSSAMAGEPGVTATAANNTEPRADANSLHCRCMSCLLPRNQLKLISLHARETNPSSARVRMRLHANLIG